MCKTDISFLCNKLHMPQNYYISQLLTIDHDCSVPVDMHGSVKTFTIPLDPLGGVKGQIF